LRSLTGSSENVRMCLVFYDGYPTLYF